MAYQPDTSSLNIGLQALMQGAQTNAQVRQQNKDREALMQRFREEQANENARLTQQLNTQIAMQNQKIQADAIQAENERRAQEGLLMKKFAMEQEQKSQSADAFKMFSETAYGKELLGTDPRIVEIAKKDPDQANKFIGLIMQKRSNGIEEEKKTLELEKARLANAEKQEALKRDVTTRELNDRKIREELEKRKKVTWGTNEISYNTDKRIGIQEYATQRGMQFDATSDSGKAILEQESRNFQNTKLGQSDAEVLDAGVALQDTASNMIDLINNNRELFGKYASIEDALKNTVGEERAIIAQYDAYKNKLTATMSTSRGQGAIMQGEREAYDAGLGNAQSPDTVLGTLEALKNDARNTFQEKAVALYKGGYYVDPYIDAQVRREERDTAKLNTVGSPQWVNKMADVLFVKGKGEFDKLVQDAIKNGMLTEEQEKQWIPIIEAKNKNRKGKK